MPGPHERAIRKDLRRIAPADRAGGLAQLGLTLARTLDALTVLDAAVVVSPRDLTAISREFHAVLGTLAKMQEPAPVANPVDELAARRDQRRTS